MVVRVASMVRVRVWMGIGVGGDWSGVSATGEDKGESVRVSIMWWQGRQVWYDK